LKALLGKKLGMTQVFAHDSVVPVTVLEVGPCFVTQVKTEENDGYAAVQIGYGEIKEKKVTKPIKKHFDKAKVKPRRHLAEYRIEKEEDKQQPGTKLACSIFETGELATVTSVSKGKGFQGVVKRWGFAGGPGGHGSRFHRSPGSIGMAATPSRVLKGMKMAGRMGGEQVTVKNLEIVKVDENQNLILVKGAVPGGKGALLMINTDGKTAKNPIKLYEAKEEKPAEEKKEKKEKAAKGTEEQAVEQDKKEAAQTEEKPKEGKQETKEQKQKEEGAKEQKAETAKKEEPKQEAKDEEVEAKTDQKQDEKKEEKVEQKAAPPKEDNKADKEKASEKEPKVEKAQEAKADNTKAEDKKTEKEDKKPEEKGDNK